MNTRPDSGVRPVKYVLFGALIAVFAYYGLAAGLSPAGDDPAWKSLRDPERLHVMAVAEVHSACGNAYGKDAGGWYAG